MADSKQTWNRSFAGHVVVNVKDWRIGESEDELARPVIMRSSLRARANDIIACDRADRRAHGPSPEPER